MLQRRQQEIKSRLTVEHISCSLDRRDLERLLKILQERLVPAAEEEIAYFEKGNQSDEDFEKNKQLLRDGFDLRLTVTGVDGQELYGTVVEVVNSPNFPEAIKSVYINSEHFLQAVHNYLPRNSFEVFLDFSRPGVMDSAILPSNRTPNGSNIKVHGYNATWVNGLFHELQEFIRQRQARCRWLHANSVYDLLVWTLGLPIGFWFCFKFGAILPQIGVAASPFLDAALYVYVFLIVLFGFRALFHYARWVFPIVEYRFPQNQSLKHRAILSALFVGFVGTVGYDIGKWIFLG